MYITVGYNNSSKAKTTTKVLIIQDDWRRNGINVNL